MRKQHVFFFFFTPNKKNKIFQIKNNFFACFLQSFCDCNKNNIAKIKMNGLGII